MADYVDYEQPPDQPKDDNLVRPGELYVFFASITLVLLSIRHVRVAATRRLWLFPSHPSRLFALNAGTLSLLSIACKFSNDYSIFNNSDYTKLLGSVLMCTLIGACIPSMATDADLKELWSTVAGVTLLGITLMVNIFLQISSAPPVIVDLRYEHLMVSLFLGMLLLVLWAQALGLEAMVSDTRAMVSDHLHMIRSDRQLGNRIGVVQEKPWTWGAIGEESNMKVMMVLTSNPQNVVARSPSAAAAGILVFSSALVLLRARFKVVFAVYPAVEAVQSPAISICTAICLLRWLQVAWHEKRPIRSAFQEVEPLYWRRKLIKMRHVLRSGCLERRPNVLEEGQYGLKESLYYAADFFLFLTVAVPLNWMLVTVIRLSHMVSVWLLRLLVWPLIRLAVVSMQYWLSRRVLSEEKAAPFEAMGIISLAGEDTATVHAHFVGAARRVIWEQNKRVNSKELDTTGLMEFLRAPSSRNARTFSVLDQKGAFEMDNLQVEHGYQYGWRLTLLSLLAVLTKVERDTLGRSQTVEACMNAFWQAKEMVKVVDEQCIPIICSKETYLAACALVWSTLPKKKPRRSQNGKKGVTMHVQNPKIILEVLQKSAEGHIKQFCETGNVAASWPMQATISYTIYTLCSNLCLWIDLKDCTSDITNGFSMEDLSKMLVDHMGSIFQELLVGCLTNLPLAVSNCMTDAVRHGKIDIVERGVFVVGQGKQLWENLHWPTPCAPVDVFGHLCQWFYPPESVQVNLGVDKV